MNGNNRPKYLNLGCGTSFFQTDDWINIDVDRKNREGVQQYQLLLGIPFADNSFEVVYHSHVLEHFPREQAPTFLKECFRVLVPGGKIRVAVPDLESLVFAYIKSVKDVDEGKDGAKDRHTWMIIELLDQMVRRYSGGLMGLSWQESNDDLASFIKSRLGSELDNIPRKLKSSSLKIFSKPLGAPEIDIDFLNSGERHCWMYDRISLASLLEEIGFINIRQVGCKTEILNGFQPDMLPNGSPRKADSIWFEAEKPQNFVVKTPKIVIFSTTDRGGAGIAAMRLQSGLRSIDVPSLSYVQYKQTNAEQIYVLPPSENDQVILFEDGFLSTTLGRNSQIQDEAIAKWPDRPKHSELFSANEAIGDLSEVPLLQEIDILNFHWVASYLDISANVDFLKNKKIVWTLHDMHPFTGGCHYSSGCEGYLHKCGNCPQLGSKIENDLSRESWQKRFDAYKKLNMYIVAPSKWLANEAKRSTLFNQFPVHCIPNGLPLDIFKPYPKDSIKKDLEIPLENKVLLFSAADVLNRRKGLAFLLDALTKLREYPEAKNVTLLLLGLCGEEVEKLDFPVKALGNLTSDQAVVAAYNAADAVVLPTLEDNLPNVLLESLACGTPCVAFDVGGVPDILDHKQTGYIAKFRDVDDLVEGLLWALQDNPHRSRLCRAQAMARWSLARQANEYLHLYEELLKA